MKRINWVRVSLAGFAAFALSFTSDSVIAAVKNEPTIFSPIHWQVLAIIVLGSLGQAAITINSQLSDGFHKDDPTESTVVNKQ